MITFILFLFTFSFFPGQHAPLTSVDFQTSDHILIKGVYEIPGLQGPVPAVIFIHQGGSSKEEWVRQPLFKLCLKKGYAVLAYDVRNHGESGKDKGGIGDLFVNPNRAPLDLKAAIHFLHADKRIDTNRIAIVGSSIGGNLACVAMNDPSLGVKCSVAMSCKTSAVRNLAGVEKLSFHNLFLIASSGDQGGQRALWAKELYDLTHDKRKLLIVKNSSAHGVSMFRDDPELGTTILNWLKDTL